MIAALHSFCALAGFARLGPARAHVEGTIPTFAAVDGVPAGAMSSDETTEAQARSMAAALEQLPRLARPGLGQLYRRHADGPCAAMAGARMT